MERFEVLGTTAPAISWVELCSAASAFGTAIDGNESLQANLQRRVIDPALELLHRLGSGEWPHTPSIRAVQAFAPSQMLPHLGVPHTRRSLRELGVAIRRPGVEFPLARIREECWVTGVEGAL